MRTLILALACVFTACAGAPIRTDHTPKEFDAKSLEGRWIIVGTTFPMWLDGKKTAPTFEYSNVQTGEGKTTMSDRVSYIEEEKAENIDGIDTQSNEVPTHFTWKGTGAKAVFSSEWDVAFVDPQGRFTIITFGATVATPAGIDVIAREQINDAAWSDALQEINAWDALRDRSKNLQRIGVDLTAH